VPREIEGLDRVNAQPQVEVIEIFSSDEDMCVWFISYSHLHNSLEKNSEQGRKSDVEEDPFLESMPGSWPANNDAKQGSSDRFGHLVYFSVRGLHVNVSQSPKTTQTQGPRSNEELIPKDSNTSFPSHCPKLKLGRFRQ
jgi:hypothetical protein